jgi:hypothetical protein
MAFPALPDEQPVINTLERIILANWVCRIAVSGEPTSLDPGLKGKE